MCVLISDICTLNWTWFLFPATALCDLTWMPDYIFQNEDVKGVLLSGVWWKTAAFTGRTATSLSSALIFTRATHKCACAKNDPWQSLVTLQLLLLLSLFILIIDDRAIVCVPLSSWCAHNITSISGSKRLVHRFVLNAKRKPCFKLHLWWWFRFEVFNLAYSGVVIQTSSYDRCFDWMTCFLVTYCTRTTPVGRSIRLISGRTKTH